jgi:hypothetical protein
MGDAYPYGTQASITLECKGSATPNFNCPFDNSASGDSGSGQVFWYRLRLKFASDYVPAPDGYNYVFETFDNGACGSCVSPTIKINTATVAGTCSTNVRTICSNEPSYSSLVPALWFQYTGGANTSPKISYIRMPDGSLQRNVWYDIVVYYKWSTTAGAVAFWINTGSGWTEIGSATNVPTAYYSGSSTPDCTVAGNTCYPMQYFTGATLYHEWTSWNQTAYFQDIVAGKTAASIGEPQLTSP